MSRFRATLSIAVLTIVPCHSPCLAQAPNRVVTAVTAGMICKQQNTMLSGPQLDCDYRVGNDLLFSIVGVGQSDVTVTVSRADAQGEYYVSVGGVHGCVIVKEGEKIRANSRDLPSYAFVSPKNGKVYSDWQTCARAP